MKLKRYKTSKKISSLIIGYAFTILLAVACSFLPGVKTAKALTYTDTIFFTAQRDAGSIDGYNELFSIKKDGSGLTQLTNFNNTTCNYYYSATDHMLERFRILKLVQNTVNNGKLYFVFYNTWSPDSCKTQGSFDEAMYSINPDGSGLVKEIDLSSKLNSPGTLSSGGLIVGSYVIIPGFNLGMSAQALFIYKNNVFYDSMEIDTINMDLSVSYAGDTIYYSSGGQIYQYNLNSKAKSVFYNPSLGGTIASGGRSYDGNYMTFIQAVPYGSISYYSLNMNTKARATCFSISIYSISGQLTYSWADNTSASLVSNGNQMTKYNGSCSPIKTITLPVGAGGGFGHMYNSSGNILFMGNDYNLYYYDSINSSAVKLSVNRWLSLSAQIGMEPITPTIPPNKPPVASFTATPPSGTAPLTVSFDGSNSSDPDGDTISWAWNFGDGTVVGTGKTTSHTYSTAGSYSTYITVCDGKVCNISATKTITVSYFCTPDSTQSCAIANGTGSQTCNGTGTAWGACTLVSCNPNYHWNGTSCTLDTHMLTVTKSGTGNGTVTGTGINCGTGGSDCYEDEWYNASVTLTTTASAGSTFTGWSGACSGTGTCTVTMTAPKTVTANFTLNTYRLNVNKSGTGSGTVTGTNINCGTDCYEDEWYGASVTLTATASAGSTFSSWGGCDTSSGTTCTVTMNAVKNVSAVFSANAPTASITVGPSAANAIYSATSILYGGSTYVKWISTNATSCSVSPYGWTGTSHVPATPAGPYYSTTTLTLTCTGPGGTVTKSVTITVYPPPASSITMTPTVSKLVSGTWQTITNTNLSVTSSTNTSGGADYTIKSKAGSTPLVVNNRMDINSTLLDAIGNVFPSGNYTWSCSYKNTAGQSQTCNSTTGALSGSTMATSGDAALQLNLSGTYTVNLTNTNLSRSYKVTTIVPYIYELK